jgi:hypothetical protein
MTDLVSHVFGPYSKMTKITRIFMFGMQTSVAIAYSNFFYKFFEHLFCINKSIYCGNQYNALIACLIVVVPLTQIRSLTRMS